MKQIEVKEGKMTWAAGIITIFISLLFLFLYLWSPAESIPVKIGCWLFVVIIMLAGLFFCLTAYKRKLTVADMELCYTSWCGKNKNFTLNEIGYCKTELTLEGNKDFLILYDLLGNKLCKLDYHMDGCYSLLQFLADNQVKIESSSKSDSCLHSILKAETICAEEAADKANAFYREAKELVEEWTRQNKKMGAEWKMGMVSYLEEECRKDKQLWEQTSCETDSFHKFPEGYELALEGYLLKDGKFVMNKKNWAVGFYIPIMRVTKSMQIGEELRIRFYQEAGSELAEQLKMLAYLLPRNRYHTEEIQLAHELKDKIDYGILSRNRKNV